MRAFFALISFRHCKRSCNRGQMRNENGHHTPEVQIEIVEVLSTPISHSMHRRDSGVQSSFEFSLLINCTL